MTYFFQSGIGLLFFYLIYQLFLQHDNQFQQNRWYLIISTCLAIVLPLLDISIHQNPEGNSVFAEVIFVISQNINEPASDVQAFTLPSGNCVIAQGFWYLYLFGLSLFTLRLSITLYRLWQVFRKGSIEVYEDHKLVLLDHPFPICSFFNYIFWSRANDFPEADEQQIKQHELVHIRQGHTLDILFFEVLCIVFWFNPVMWLLRYRIREVHEYIADQQAVKRTKSDSYAYAQLLLKQAKNYSKILPIMHHFNFLSTKKRLIMISKWNKRSFPGFSLLMGFPIALMIFCIFSCTKSMEAFSTITSNQTSSEEVYVTSLEGEEILIKKGLRVIACDPQAEENKAFFNEDGSVKDYNGLVERHYQSLLENNETVKKEDIVVVNRKEMDRMLFGTATKNNNPNGFYTTIIEDYQVLVGNDFCVVLLKENSPDFADHILLRKENKKVMVNSKGLMDKMYNLVQKAGIQHIQKEQIMVLDIDGKAIIQDQTQLNEYWNTALGLQKRGFNKSPCE